MTKITVVSYCHEAHQEWIEFWAKQINAQTFRDFDILFIAHNWGEEGHAQVMLNSHSVRHAVHKHLDDDLYTRLLVQSYWSDPVIGDVIDFGCETVETDYFAHWDVDDIIHPERLALQSTFLDANPNIDFLGTRMVGFNGDPAPEMLELDYIQPDEPNLNAIDHDAIKHCILNKNQNCLGHTTMIYRPEAMQALGGFSRSDVKTDGKSPDFETWKKALMAGYQFYRLPELCALWRLDSSSIRTV